MIFSSVAIIGEHDGKRTLMFRMANARSTAIVEATCHVYLSRDEILADGEPMRRIYDLPLRRGTSPIFSLSWLATHTIDAASPIADLTSETLAAAILNIIVTFQGIDDRLAATVHTRYAYNTDDIVFDRRFADIFRTDRHRHLASRRPSSTRRSPALGSCVASRPPRATCAPPGDIPSVILRSNPHHALFI